MSFTNGQRVRFKKFWRGTGTVVSTPRDGGLSSFISVKANSDATYRDGGSIPEGIIGGFLADELEDASCCGNATGEFCPECPLTGSESIMARESTAPNADRITRLETQTAVLEDKVQELTDALADQQALIQTMAASIGSLWLDVCGG